MLGRTLALAVVALPAVFAATELPWSSPHHYPGKPNGSYSEEWQSYFEVKDPLPNVTFPLPRSWAGSISVQDAANPNNTAFFWGFENANGSFTSHNETKPWIIWFAGGPGYSSIASALLENGPISVSATYAMSENPYSWHQLADIIFVDNPVGVGFSTVGKGGYAKDEEEIANDIQGFLENLVRVFPGLKKRPLLMVGESYSSRFISYWMKVNYGLPEANRTVTLSKIVVGNPALQDASVYENIGITQLVETYPQIINYDISMYDYIREQSHLCHYDLNLTFPQTGGKFKNLHVNWGELGHITIAGTTAPPGAGNAKRDLMGEIKARYEALPGYQKQPHVREEARKRWMKENLGSRDSSIAARADKKAHFNTTLTGKLDKWYACDLFYLTLEYAVNYTYPFTAIDAFDYLSVPYAVNPVLEVLDPYFWMNDNATRNAIHAPYNEEWTVIAAYPWHNKPDGSDESLPTMAFMDELAANATANNVTVMWYSGNDDALTPHITTLMSIQNTTFGGIQGFTKEPTTAWYDDQGLYAGIVHQERGWVYLVMYGAGHQTPVTQPARSYVMAREFIVGNNPLGTVNPQGDIATTAKPATATDAVLIPDGVLIGQPEIIVLGATTTEIVVWPTETIAAFDSHLLALYESLATATTKVISTSSEKETSTSTTKVKVTSTSSAKKVSSTSVAKTSSSAKKVTSTTKATSSAKKVTSTAKDVEPTTM